MDVSDVQVVIMYGSPSNINQLHQLTMILWRMYSLWTILLPACSYVVKQEEGGWCLVLMCTTALSSRSGMQWLKVNCAAKENSRRLPCCDSCDTTKSSSNLAFEAVACATGTQKRWRAAWDIDESLRLVLRRALMSGREPSILASIC